MPCLYRGKDAVKLENFKNMREILTRTGEVKELMRIFSVSKPTVINALKYRVNTQLACRIRKTAIERGGVEAVCTTQQNTARV